MEIETDTEDLYSAMLIGAHFSSVWEIQFRDELAPELFCKGQTLTGFQFVQKLFTMKMIIFFFSHC